MLKIDLHGYTYSKVRDILPNWLINNYNNGIDDFEIITGNSEQMKQIVKLICSEMDLEPRIIGMEIQVLYWLVLIDFRNTLLTKDC